MAVALGAERNWRAEVDSVTSHGETHVSWNAVPNTFQACTIDNFLHSIQHILCWYLTCLTWVYAEDCLSDLWMYFGNSLWSTIYSPYVFFITCDKGTLLIQCTSWILYCDLHHTWLRVRVIEWLREWKGIRGTILLCDTIMVKLLGFPCP